MTICPSNSAKKKKEKNQPCGKLYTRNIGINFVEKVLLMDEHCGSMLIGY